MGVVHDIGLFATTIITPLNETIVVPNSAITGGLVTNYTKQGTLRGDIGVGVAYGNGIAAVMKVLLDAARQADCVSRTPNRRSPSSKWVLHPSTSS